MIPVSADCELVTAYATRGSENAFRARVTRQVNLLNASEPKHNAMGGPIPLDGIPEMFRARLQDLIALAQSQPSRDGN